MWGNKQGWIISACIFAATVVLYAVLLLGPSISSPTELTTKAGALDAIALPAVPMPSAVEGAGDPAALYQQAIDAYNADADSFDKYYASAGKLNTDGFKAIQPALDLLVQAAGSGKAPIFAKKPDAVVMYNPAQVSALKPAEMLGRDALRVGLQYNAAKNKEQSKKYLQAAYMLGYNMASERLVYHELRIGQDLMVSAAINLSTIDADHGADYKPVDAAFKDFMDSQQKFIDLCNPANDATIATNAGDVFNLAEHSQERMWRDEAIMMLGHFKYNAAQPGDQRGAVTVLNKIAAEPNLDPAVAAAVKAALALTIEDHRTSMSLPN